MAPDAPARSEAPAPLDATPAPEGEAPEAEPHLGDAPAVDESTDPWAVYPGRVGRIRVVDGTFVAVFGAVDPEFVGRLPERDNYGDMWIESTLVDAGAHRPPSSALGLPIDVERRTRRDGPVIDRYELELGAAVEVHDHYASPVIGRPARDELVARGFRVEGCGVDGTSWPAWEAPSPCRSADLFVAGPVRVLDLPPRPSVRAPAAVVSSYAASRDTEPTDELARVMRAVVVEPTLEVYWVDIATPGEEVQPHVVHLRPEDPTEGLLLNVEPRMLLVAGDSFFIASLDDPIRLEDPRRVQLHRFRQGHRTIQYSLN